MDEEYIHPLENADTYGDYLEMIGELRYSCAGEPRTKCLKCGSWKPAEYKYCWKCYATTPAEVLKSYEKKRVIQ